MSKLVVLIVGLALIYLAASGRLETVWNAITKTAATSGASR